jgi:GDP-4-dehydro-6-deoxy-D-mannose reductase
MKALITGDRGFVGGHLQRKLTELGYEVFGFDIKSGDDIRDYEQVRNALDSIRPDYIYHLAAQAYVAESFTAAARTFEVNTIGSTNLLEAVRQVGIKPCILLAGTSEEYGDATAPTGPTDEGSLPNPLSPYAISKLAMDYMGQLYSRSYGMRVVVARTFNHTGPGRGEMYAESAFAKQIVEIEQGRRELLEHGNLEWIRNYTDVRDIVNAYVQAITLPPGIYNIASDQNISIKKVLDMLTAEAECDITRTYNPALHRPSDFSFHPPSCEKFKKLTGWIAQIPLADTLAEILADWRERLA